jgi:nucleoside-diphosphate-sugar epimerase
MSGLVTGASGFLGGRLAQMLVERGEEVVILARPTSDLRHLSGLPIQIIYADLSEVDKLKEAVRDVDRIFHCAACSDYWAPWNTYYQANVVGTQNLLTAAREATHLKRFVHVSTADVYGYPATPCSEDHPLTDAGLPYNQTKCQGEVAVWKAQQDFGLPITILRPATIYGPRGQGFVVEIAKLLRQRLMLYVDAGKVRGGFTYVDNVAEAMIQASESETTLGQAYNISDGTGATWTSYVGALAKGLGYRQPWLKLPFRISMSLAAAIESPHALLKLSGRPMLTRHVVYILGIDQEFPTDRARRDFGFTPKISLSEGIARSVAWLKQTANES